jgi:hypothetical protein
MRNDVAQHQQATAQKRQGSGSISCDMRDLVEFDLQKGCILALGADLESLRKQAISQHGEETSLKRGGFLGFF